MSSPSRSDYISPANVSVVLCGYPTSLAVETAKALANTGCNIILGVGTESTTKSREGIDIVNHSDPQLKTKMQEVVNDARNKGNIVIGVDVSENPSSAMFSELGMPFVINTREGARENVRTDKALAVLADDFNKYNRAFEEMWQSTARRFPGLLSSGWELEGSEMMPGMMSDFSRTTELMRENFNRLLGASMPDDAVKRVHDKDQQQENRGQEEQQKEPRKHEKAGKSELPTHHLEGHAESKYNFRNTDGSSTFSFKTSYLGDAPAAEGVVDSVMFLARKAAQQARPRVFGLLDVIESPWMRLSYF